MLSIESLKQVEKEVAKYPADRKSSAVMAALRIAQDEHGSLTVPLMDFIAELLGMRPIAVYEVATFYSMYELKPVGKHKICICTNVSCMLCGCDQIVKHLEKRLGIKLGETTNDGKFTLKEVECLGACVDAPMFQIGNTYYERLTPQKVDEILAGLK